MTGQKIDSKSPEIASASGETTTRVSQYKCPFCEYTDNTERKVRLHISREDDSKHDYNGFSADVAVEALDETGNLLREEYPEQVPHGDSGRLETSLVNGSLSEPQRTILLTSIENPSVESLDEIKRLAEARLEDELSIETVKTALKTRMSQTTESDSEEQPTKAFEELTPRQQAVLVEYARDERDNLDRTDVEISDAAGVDSTYPRVVKQKYGYLIDNLAEKENLPNVTVQTDEPEEVQEELTVEEAVELTQFGADDDVEAYENLTDEEKTIVHEAAKRPWDSPEVIADRLDTNVEHVTSVLDEYSDAVELRQRAVALRPIVDKTVDDATLREWFNRTEKQKSALIELAKFEHPKDPTDFQTPAKKYAGVHPTYFSTVAEKYGHLAEKLQAEAFQNHPSDESESESEEESESESETYTCGYPTEDGVCSRTVSEEDARCWQHEESEKETGTEEEPTVVDEEESVETEVSEEPVPEQSTRDSGSTDETSEDLQLSEGVSLATPSRDLEDSVPVSELEALRNELEMISTVSKSELSAGVDGGSSSASRKATADAAIDRISELINEYSGSKSGE